MSMGLARLKRAATVVSVLIILASVSLGCSPKLSKDAYEERMVKILGEVAEKSAPIQTGLSSISVPPMGPDEKEFEKLKADQIKVLEDAAEEVGAIVPPDEFFTGHSMIKEFLGLLIKALKAPKPKLEEQPEEEQMPFPGAESEVIETLGEATQAYARAAQELPFLERELKAGFNEVLSWAQRQIYQ